MTVADEHRNGTGLKAPFPYFGGKSAVAHLIWERLGDCPNVVEPFFGSGALLLARPHWDAERQDWVDGMTRLETVNDADGLLCNAWRSIQADPERTAYYADWPVSEADLTARHIWLVQRKGELTERLMGDPEWYDAKAAGWWLWGISCWIGGGWCSGEGPWAAVDGRLVHLGDADMGVHRKRVHLIHVGKGVHRRLVHLGDAGTGVHRQRVHLGPGGNGMQNLYDWFAALSSRLRRVRVCCGDWTRVLGPTPTIKQGLTGVFLDPPYPEGRTEGIYAVDSLTVAEGVRRWAIEWGNHPLMRICVAGYELPGYEFPPDWEVVAWKAKGGYGNQGQGAGRENVHRERLWFSPGCLKPGGPVQRVLPL